MTFVNEIWGVVPALRSFQRLFRRTSRSHLLLQRLFLCCGLPSKLVLGVARSNNFCFSSMVIEDLDNKHAHISLAGTIQIYKRIIIELICWLKGSFWWQISYQ